MKLYKVKKSNIDKKGLYATNNIKVGTGPMNMDQIVKNHKELNPA